MSYDPTVPARLATIQRWFGGIITQNMYNTLEYDEEPSTYIASTANLSALERMQIYNQSYWLRLLEALHEVYPFLSRLFGKASFDDEIGAPYLTAHPPAHWSLNLLGNELTAYLHKTYHAKDRELVLKAAEIDWACQHCFFAKALPEIDLMRFSDDKAEELLYLPLKLQPTVHLIKTNGDYMHFREAFLKHDHDYWLDNDFPKLDKETPYHFILYRNNHLNISWDTLEPLEYDILKSIEHGKTLDEALATAEESEDIALWIQKWLLCKWLAL